MRYLFSGPDNSLISGLHYTNNLYTIIWFKYSNVIQIIYTKLYGFKYSDLTSTISEQLLGFK